MNEKSVGLIITVAIFLIGQVVLFVRYKEESRTASEAIKNLSDAANNIYNLNKNNSTAIILKETSRFANIYRKELKKISYVTMAFSDMIEHQTVVLDGYGKFEQYLSGELSNVYKNGDNNYKLSNSIQMNYEELLGIVGSAGFEQQYKKYFDYESKLKKGKFNLHFLKQAIYFYDNFPEETNFFDEIENRKLKDSFSNTISNILNLKSDKDFQKLKLSPDESKYLMKISVNMISSLQDSLNKLECYAMFVKASMLGERVLYSILSNVYLNEFKRIYFAFILPSQIKSAESKFDKIKVSVTYSNLILLFNILNTMYNNQIKILEIGEQDLEQVKIESQNAQDNIIKDNEYKLNKLNEPSNKMIDMV